MQGVEYRTAENLNKQIFVASGWRPSAGEIDLTLEWQRCDLFGDGGTDHPDRYRSGRGQPVAFATDGLDRLREGLGVEPESVPEFLRLATTRMTRAGPPYRGWEPLETADAAVFFGRDAADCARAGCPARHAECPEVECLVRGARSLGNGQVVVPPAPGSCPVCGVRTAPFRGARHRRPGQAAR